MIKNTTRKRFQYSHIIFYCCALLFVFVEGGIFYPLSFFSVKPNLLLLLLTFYVFYFNFQTMHLLFFSLFCGLLKDSLSGVAFGTHIILFLAVAAILRHLSKNFLRYNWVFVIPLFAVATFSYAIISYLMQPLFFQASSVSFWVLLRIAIIELLYGLFIFWIFLKPIKRCVIDKLS